MHPNATSAAGLRRYALPAALVAAVAGFAGLAADGSGWIAVAGLPTLLAASAALALPAAYVAYSSLRGELPDGLFWPVWILIFVFMAFASWAWLAPAYSVGADQGAARLSQMLHSRVFTAARVSVALFAAAGIAALFARRFGEPVRGFIPAFLLPGVLLAAWQPGEWALSNGREVLAAGYGVTAFAAFAAVAVRLFATPAIRAQLAPEGLLARPGIDRNNLVFAWLLGLFASPAASAASILYWAAAVWALPGTVLRRYPLRFLTSDGPIVGAALIYAGVFALMTLINLQPGDPLLPTFVDLAPVALLPLVILRFRVSSGEAILNWLQFGAVIGLLLALPVALYDAFFQGQTIRRAAAFSGNPTILAHATVVVIAICLTGLDRLPRQQRLMRAAAILSGILVVLLCASVSVTLSLLCVMGLAAWRYRRDFRAALGDGGVQRRWLIAAGAAAGLLAVAAVPIADRVVNQFIRVIAVEPLETPGSVAMRGVMWSAGAKAVAAAPLTGYGVQNRFGAIRPWLTDEQRQTMNFSHLHNGYVTAAVAAGIPGLLATLLYLAAPLWAAWRYARGPRRSDLIYLSAAVSATYAVHGMFGIMFFHDALDCMFAYMAVFAAVMIGDSMEQDPSQA